MNYRLVNKTPHPITLITDGETIEYEADKNPTRLVNAERRIGTININGSSIDAYETTDGEFDNLPPKKNNILYIVSNMVKERLPNRMDLVTPTKFVRDDDGRIIGAKGVKVHPEQMRDPEDVTKYPRWVECEVCGKQLDSKRWNKNRKGIIRTIEVTNRNGVTLRAPEINKEFDIILEGETIRVWETGYSDKSKNVQFKDEGEM